MPPTWSDIQAIIVCRSEAVVAEAATGGEGEGEEEEEGDFSRIMDLLKLSLVNMTLTQSENAVEVSF